MLARGEPIDLVKVAGMSRLLLVGDDHTQPAIKQFLADELAFLQGVGFSSLAIEMIPTNLQGDLDAWTPEAQERIRQHLAMAWSEKGPGVADSLFALIRKAKERDMMVLALDPPDAWRWNRVTVNPYWADCIRHCLRNNFGTRMIVFAGRSHVDPTPSSLSSLLGTDGLPLSVIAFAGLDSEETVQMDLKTARLLGRPAHPTTLLTQEGYQTGQRRNCMVSCPIKSCCQNASNWIVHLPEAPPLSLAQR